MKQLYSILALVLFANVVVGADKNKKTTTKPSPAQATPPPPADEDDVPPPPPAEEDNDVPPPPAPEEDDGNVPPPPPAEAPIALPPAQQPLVVKKQEVAGEAQAVQPVEDEPETLYQKNILMRFLPGQYTKSSFNGLDAAAVQALFDGAIVSNPYVFTRYWEKYKDQDDFYKEHSYLFTRITPRNFGSILKKESPQLQQSQFQKDILIRAFPKKYTLKQLDAWKPSQINDKFYEEINKDAEPFRKVFKDLKLKLDYLKEERGYIKGKIK